MDRTKHVFEIILGIHDGEHQYYDTKLFYGTWIQAEKYADRYWKTFFDGRPAKPESWGSHTVVWDQYGERTIKIESIAEIHYLNVDTAHGSQHLRLVLIEESKHGN